MANVCDKNQMCVCDKNQMFQNNEGKSHVHVSRTKVKHFLYARECFCVSLMALMPSNTERTNGQATMDFLSTQR